MRNLGLTMVLFASCATAQPAHEPVGEPITTYLDEAVKKVELEQIVARYSRSTEATAKGSVNELRPIFDAAFEAAAASKDTQDALDEHWLVVNRCLNAGGDTRFERNRHSASCDGDLAAAKAKVELKWSRHKP